MDKTECIEELFSGVEKEGCTLSETIQAFNTEFNRFNVNGGVESEQTKRLRETLFEEDSSIHFGLQESTIRSQIELYPKNVDESEVLTKVALINELYSTRLNGSRSGKTISVVDMTKHIVEMAKSKDLDAKIQDGDIEAVDLIGKIKGYNNEVSFASKYCSWHNIVVYNGDAYPIMDGYTKGFIYYWCQSQYCELRKSNGRKYTQNDISEYKTFCDVIKEFRKLYCSDLSLKAIDSFLWLYGKEKELAF